MIRGKTKSGFAFVLEEKQLNNYELIELVAEVEENPLVLPKLLTAVLGKEQKEKLMDHLRNEDGVIPIEKMQGELTQIFTVSSKTKNS